MYNLDVVIAVGYRVNSYEATQFRIWATQVLREYLTKGFVLDDERLKGKNVFGADYFDDLLDRIREIRISERRYYQKITDIYSECSSDYDKDSEETQLFFKTVQNMMHYAVTKQTAAEIIYDRADAERPHMGLTTWKNAPDGRVVKSDVTVAKNYLSEKEVDSLNRLSNAFIDIAEQRAEDHILIKGLWLLLRPNLQAQGLEPEGLRQAHHGAWRAGRLQDGGAGAPEHRGVSEGDDAPGRAREARRTGHLLAWHHWYSCHLCRGVQRGQHRGCEHELPS